MDNERDEQEPSDRRPERVAHHDRLWTPWRMRYITGEAREQGCIFCNRRDAADDVAALVLYRGHHAYVIMNLFPYNTGHVMVVPNVHADSLEGLPRDALVEMAELAPRVTAALRRVLRCDGFNLGLNIGSIAGAGVAEHLHQHVVPRWRGDANFMPILASTMVLPELIPATYAKVRAELERELQGARKVEAVVLTDDDQVVLLRDDALPTAEAAMDTPLWRSALEMALEASAEVEITGWAGQQRSGVAGDDRPPALVVRTRGNTPSQRWTPVRVTDIMASGDDSLTESVRRALDVVTPDTHP
jgi:ATP adenylyltransferase